MTNNQIRYQEHLETARHNVASETELNRHNVQTEKLGWSNLAELSRHNVASEGIGWAQVAELGRHNLAQESISWHQAETSRQQADAASANAHTNVYDAITGRIQTGNQGKHWTAQDYLVERGQDLTYDIGQQNIDFKYAELGVKSAIEQQKADAMTTSTNTEIARTVSSEGRQWVFGIVDRVNNKNSNWSGGRYVGNFR